MKIVVFGATGGTGKRIVERALAEGHEVVAVARKPEAITTQHARLKVVKGDVLNPASVAAAIAGADAVLSSVGPADDKNPGTLMSDAAKNIVAACEQASVRRFVFESGLMVGDAKGLSPIGRTAVSLFRWLNKKLTADKRIAEGTIQASSLEWVIVRPVVLDDSPARGNYKFGTDVRINPAKKLSHADVADFMIKVAADPKVARTIQDIGH